MGNWGNCEDVAEAPTDSGLCETLGMDAWKLLTSRKGTENFCEAWVLYRDYAHNRYLKIQTPGNSENAGYLFVFLIKHNGYGR